MHTTNYFDTFIEVAEDSPASKGEVPPYRGDKKSVANLQYEMLEKNPYRYTSDDVLFSVYADRKDILESDRAVARAEYFSKGQPCFRASPLTKRYGWGVHANSEGKIALFAMNSDTYQVFCKDDSIAKTKAMRNKRR